MAVHVIGLTGGIASGKTTVAALLAARGAAVVDADQLARQVVEPGQPALAELVARFGAAILASDGQLDRKRLAAIAFADPAARTDLGKITHPRIAAASAAAIATWADAGANVVFYEAALLVENRAHTGLAGLIVVAAPAEVQHARLVARDRMSPDDAHARIAAQAPLADKLAAATWVVENTGDRDALEREVARIAAEIEARLGPIRVPKLPRAASQSDAAGRAARVARPATLVTGFPAFTAKRMIGKLLAEEPETKLYVLATGAAAAEAAQFLATLPDHAAAEVLAGDVCDMDLGLSSAEYRALSRELTWIHHLAGVYFMGVDEATARRVNVTGTRTVLDLARDATRLERVVHWSTAMVSGDHRGAFREDDLEAGQKFRNAYERTKFEAERLVRAAMRQLPITVVRPGIIVGDSRTGEIDTFDGPYYLMVLIATNESRVRLPLLGRSAAPLHLVPIDYVVDAAWHIARSEAAAGKTFHLVDPAPLAARAVFEGVAEHAHTEKPRGHIPRPIARAVLKTPGLSRLGRGPLAFLDVLDHTVQYDQTNTLRALAGTGVRCPPLADYLPVLVRYVLEVTRGAAPAAGAEPDAAELDDVSDSLDEA
ncbi:MAG TPA: dephospho-CoA kinase [Kofleriaceae bacterium]|nr:dephospho-CoA kinase [Kofleriaceae bacterium]